MIQRCTNPNSDSFHLYGERGISIDPAWMTFAVFAQWAIANGYSDKLELDREQVDESYGPENCRFVTRTVNARNRRCTRWLDLARGRVSLAEAVEISGITGPALMYRIHVMGMTPEEAVTRPKSR